MNSDEAKLRELDDLVARAKRGEATALNELFVRHVEPVLSRVRRRMPAMLRDRMESMDLVQTGIREAIENFERFEHRGGDSFYRWLCRIVEFKMLGKITHWGAARRDPRRISQQRDTADESAVDSVREVASPEPGPQSQVADSEMRAWIDQSIEALPEPSREVLRLHLSGLTDAKIARRLSKSPDAVRRARAAGIYKLSRRYRHAHGDDSFAK